MIRQKVKSRGTSSIAVAVRKSSHSQITSLVRNKNERKDDCQRNDGESEESHGKDRPAETFRGRPVSSGLKSGPIFVHIPQNFKQKNLSFRQQDGRQVSKNSLHFDPPCTCTHKSVSGTIEGSEEEEVEKVEEEQEEEKEEGRGLRGPLWEAQRAKGAKKVKLSPETLNLTLSRSFVRVAYSALIAGPYHDPIWPPTASIRPYGERQCPLYVPGVIAVPSCSMITGHPVLRTSTMTTTTVLPPLPPLPPPDNHHHHYHYYQAACSSTKERESFTRRNATEKRANQGGKKRRGIEEGTGGAAAISRAARMSNSQEGRSRRTHPGGLGDENKLASEHWWPFRSLLSAASQRASNEKSPGYGYACYARRGG
ncbi:hypothetical protein WH47_10106 [Habropoda laboriosa]|uniref:Uncharacterized protein n=1 Tax=Habropoda laboriosa TaxID=597456 RepID=A0A0L7RFX0_9HYME|nr:hypothetical protein WH47_10106 [Habropoda laboriosa]